MSLEEATCLCGCGKATTIIERNYISKGLIKGEHYPFKRGHGKLPKIRYKVDSVSGCWVWEGTISGAGYGTLKKEQKSLKAHRYMYEKLIGLIPKGMHLDHLCRNRACVNPNHLEPVSQAENNRRGKNSKLKKEDVYEIRFLCSGNGSLRQQDIAEIYDVTYTHINSIILNRSWVI